jgi:hypothetical protein
MTKGVVWQTGCRRCRCRGRRWMPARRSTVHPRDRRLVRGDRRPLGRSALRPAPHGSPRDVEALRPALARQRSSFEVTGPPSAGTSHTPPPRGSSAAGPRSSQPRSYRMIGELGLDGVAEPAHATPRHQVRRGSRRAAARGRPSRARLFLPSRRRARHAGAREGCGRPLRGAERLQPLLPRDGVRARSTTASTARRGTSRRPRRSSTPRVTARR